MMKNFSTDSSVSWKILYDQKCVFIFNVLESNSGKAFVILLGFFVAVGFVFNYVPDT